MTYDARFGLCSAASPERDDVNGNVGAWGFAHGGMAAITPALARSLAASGGEVRAGFGVDRILVQGGPSV